MFIRALAFLALSFVLIFPIRPARVLAQESYKIGAVFTMTGPASSISIDQIKTVEMVSEQINASGGINAWHS